MTIIIISIIHLTIIALGYYYYYSLFIRLIISLLILNQQLIC